MKRMIAVLNELEREDIFSRYAIGGAMGATSYTKPFLTFDLDDFVVLPSTAGGSVRVERGLRYGQFLVCFDPRGDV